MNFESPNITINKNVMEICAKIRLECINIETNCVKIRIYSLFRKILLMCR